MCTHRFLTVYVGTSVQWDELCASTARAQYLQTKLPVLVPETQLFPIASWTQTCVATPTSKLYSLKSFPFAQYSRYVKHQSYRFAILEMRSFFDVPSPAKVGVAWVELYGENGTPEVAPAALCEKLQMDQHAVPPLTSLPVQVPCNQ